MTAPVTITTGTAEETSKTGRILDAASNGVLWAVVYRSATTLVEFWYSTDDGGTWSHDTTGGDLTGMSSDRCYAFFIDQDDYAHFLFTDGSVPSVKYYRGTPNAGRTSWTWSSVFTAASGFAFSEFDASVVAHREGTGWKVHGMCVPAVSGTTRIQYIRINITSGGTPSTDISTELKNFGVSTVGSVGIDFNHTGDGKTVAGSTPHAYVVYGSQNNSLFFKKATYSAGSWNFGSEVTLDASAPDKLSMHFDGARTVVGYVRAADAGVVRVRERDAADTTTTINDPTAISDGTTVSVTTTYTSAGDIYLVAIGNSTLDPKWIRYNRASTSWGSWTTIEVTTVVSGANARIGRGNIDCVYSNGTNVVRFDRISTIQKGEVALQGVGSMSSQAAINWAGQVNLQGVGSLGSLGQLINAGQVALQGIGSLSGEPFGIPSLDFTVFDAYIDGPGTSGAIGLIFQEDDQAKPSTISKRLQPARQDVGNNPWEIRTDTGDMFAQGDFSHGMGQLYYHRSDRDEKAYYWSEGFDISEPGVLRHLNETIATQASANIGALAQFNGLPFVADGTSVYRGDGNFPPTWTLENPNLAEGAQTVQDLVSDGAYLYAALGTNGIHRRDTAGTWTHWSAVAAKKLAWVKQRIVASDGTQVYEMNMGAGTGTSLETLPTGWLFTDIFEAGAYIFACAVNVTAGLSEIHAFGLNPSGNLVKVAQTVMPRNQLAYSGRGYLNAAYIGVGKVNASGGLDPVIYQAIPDADGFLALVKLIEGSGSGANDLSVLAFEPIGEAMLCGWSIGTDYVYGGRDGIAVHDFRKDAFAPHLKTPNAATNKQVKSILFYKGRALFTVVGSGVFYQDTAHYVAEADLIPSAGDWNTAQPKVWDQITINHNALPSGASVRVAYTTKLPASNSWVDALVSSTAGSDGAVSTLTSSNKSRFFDIKIQSFANAAKTLAPEIVSFAVRSNPAQDKTEFQLTRFVRLLKEDRKDEQGEEIYMDPQARRKILQALPYLWVKLYEPGVVWTVRVESVADVRPIGPIFQETSGETLKDGFVMQLVMAGTRD